MIFVLGASIAGCTVQTATPKADDPAAKQAALSKAYEGEMSDIFGDRLSASTISTPSAELVASVELSSKDTSATEPYRMLAALDSLSTSDTPVIVNISVPGVAGSRTFSAYLWNPTSQEQLVSLNKLPAHTILVMTGVEADEVKSAEILGEVSGATPAFVKAVAEGQKAVPTPGTTAP
jgi:hypothetical protein